MKDETYQGYTNHATWVVSLWLDNTQTAYKLYQAICEQPLDKATKAYILSEVVRMMVISQEGMSVGTRGDNWGAGIAGDWRTDEDIEQVNWLEVIDGCEAA
jgi:hypothetical protein